MLAAEALTPDEQLADEVARFYHDPLGFVMFAYEWDTDPQLQVCELPFPYSLIFNSKYGPDLWACQFLEDLGRNTAARSFDGIHAVEPIRESIASGHGIGKSAMCGWLVNWIMSTRPHSVGTVTANTGPQLESKTWAEIAKWTKRCITGHWFNVSTGRGAMKMTHREHPESWKCFAQTCAPENSEAFAGQHAPTATSFYLFDEASKIEDIFDEVSEGGMSDGEPMKFAFGNPTRNSGWFKGTFGGQAHRWGHRHIDSRDVQITNKKLIDQHIEDHGIDSDFVKVRVRGLFPAQSAKQFISTADVDAAYGRPLRREQYEWAPKILTLDPAWEGDDELVFGLRQGLRFQILAVMDKNDDDVFIAKKLADFEDEHEADAVFVDAGYGTGIVSIGRALKRNWLLVWFGGEATDKGCLNKRAEMWRDVRNWLKAGGSIPPDPTLHRDLVTPETISRMDGKIQLESKRDMKERGEASPGRADALAISFAFPVTAKKLRDHHEAAMLVAARRPGEHDPFAGTHTGGLAEHDPFANLA